MYAIQSAEAGIKKATGVEKLLTQARRKFTIMKNALIRAGMLRQ